MIRASIVLLVALLGTGGLSAQELSRFRLASRTGPESVGSLRSLTGAGTLELQGKTLVTAEADQWYALRRVGEPLPPFPLGLHVVLTSGDRIPVTRPRLDGDRFHFTHPDLDAGKETGCSPGALSLIWWAAPGQSDGETLLRRLLRERRKEDRTQLRNGDRVSGIPARLDATTLVLQADGDNRTLDLKQVACLALNSDLTESLVPAERYYRVLFRSAGDGEATRISLSTLHSDGETIGGKTLFGALLRVPVSRVLAVDVVNGPAYALTDLKPVTEKQNPYLDWRWPIGVDGTAGDRDLRLGDSTYERGLALAAGTTITYRLDGQYRRFEGLVGLDPVVGREGGVKLEILLDGKPVALESPELLGARVVRPLAIDVAGVKELLLSVQPGRRGAVQGHVNWVETRLVK